METPEHLPVMAAEVVKLFVTRVDGRYVDCTVNGGGHAYHVLNNAPSGRLLGVDVDPAALARAEVRLRPFGERATLVRGNFADVGEIADRHGFGEADGVLFDLGFSSLQLEDASRGFSYSTEGPIDMRLDQEAGVTAGELIARMSERDLAGVIAQYGEERRAHPIARAILEARDAGRLETTGDLARAVVSTKPHQRNKTLSRVFQAGCANHDKLILIGNLDNLVSNI